MTEIRPTTEDALDWLKDLADIGPAAERGYASVALATIRALQGQAEYWRRANEEMRPNLDRACAQRDALQAREGRLEKIVKEVAEDMEHPPHEHYLMKDPAAKCLCSRCKLIRAARQALEEADG